MLTIVIGLVKRSLLEKRQNIYKTIKQVQLLPEISLDLDE